MDHLGKDTSKGGRGSNALNAAADVTMQVDKLNTYNRVRVEEMKDGPEGQEWRFRLVPYDLGIYALATNRFDHLLTE